MFYHLWYDVLSLLYTCQSMAIAVMLVCITMFVLLLNSVGEDYDCCKKGSCHRRR